MTLATSPASGAPTAPRCAHRSLVVWVGPVTGAAGSTIAEFGFTNHSVGACSLHGYPYVQMLTRSGETLSTFDQKAPGAFKIQAETVVLAASKTAYFGVVYADQTGYGSSTCPTSAALRFSAPQVSGTLTLHGSRAEITPYGGTTRHLKCGVLHVTAVTASRFQ